MQEELITFETAKLAKEKEFNEISETMYVVNEHSVREQSSGKPYWKGETTIYRPTQSVLAKWLREVHNIDVEVDGIRVLHRKTEGYVATVYSEKKVLFNWNTGKMHNSYEEALERGLQEALNLIE